MMAMRSLLKKKPTLPEGEKYILKVTPFQVSILLVFPNNLNKMNNVSGISLHRYATCIELFIFSVTSTFQRSTAKNNSVHTFDSAGFM